MIELFCFVISLHSWTGMNVFNGSVVERRTPEQHVGGSKSTSAVLCP